LKSAAGRPIVGAAGRSSKAGKDLEKAAIGGRKARFERKWGKPHGVREMGATFHSYAGRTLAAG
jgi:hypothetical protein